MSIRIMSEVWDTGPADRGELLVLLALADFSDDRGECWPSVATIGAKARMEGRSVQRILRKLEADGWVAIDKNAARNGCNRYTISTPDKMSPRQNVALTQTTPPPDARVTPPLTPVSPEPSLNHQEPSSSKKDASADVREPLEVFATPKAVASFMAYRRKSKAGALTPTAAKRLAASLRTIFDSGGDPDDALGLAEERGWKTVKPEWYFKEQAHDNRTSRHHNSNSPGHSADRIIAFAARAGRTPSSDCF